MGDFRSLSNGVRERILRWGLTDRDELVQDAAKKMFNFRWLDDADGDILEVLERLHLPGSNPESLQVKELAMVYFWSERADVLKNLEFDAGYWESLNPEAIFLVRSFSEFCKANKSLEHIGEEKMPEVTRIAFYLQRHLNNLVSLLTLEGVDEYSSDNENHQRGALLDQQFIVEQMLAIALSADYGDEVGRRKMFALMRDSLALVQLPDAVTKLIVKVLAKISLDEKHFCMLALEVIAEIQDELEDDPLVTDSPEMALPEDDNESFHSALSDIEVHSEEAIKRAAVTSAEHYETRALLELSIHLKCLFIAQCMLENVHSELMQNSHLVTMLNGLVVPAVRSHEASIRELGLRCLGLSCLLDKVILHAVILCLKLTVIFKVTS